MKDDWERRASIDLLRAIQKSCGDLDGYYETATKWFDEIVATYLEGTDYADSAATALDMGCGAGRYLPELASRFSTVIGTDISPTMTAAARDHLGDNPSITVHETDGDPSWTGKTWIGHGGVSPAQTLDMFEQCGLGRPKLAPRTSGANADITRYLVGHKPA
jgi:SAM-dependent methyltransferase